MKTRNNLAATILGGMLAKEHDVTKDTGFKSSFAVRNVQTALGYADMILGYEDHLENQKKADEKKNENIESLSQTVQETVDEIINVTKSDVAWYNTASPGSKRFESERTRLAKIGLNALKLKERLNAVK